MASKDVEILIIEDKSMASAIYACLQEYNKILHSRRQTVIDSDKLYGEKFPYQLRINPEFIQLVKDHRLTDLIQGIPYDHFEGNAWNIKRSKAGDESLVLDEKTYNGHLRIKLHLKTKVISMLSDIEEYGLKTEELEYLIRSMDHVIKLYKIKD